MDINRVRYFHIFSETGSLVAASKVLHISQPALSKAIKQLEQEVGAPLVEANGRGLKLTSQGEEFKKKVAPLLSQWLSLPSQFKNGLIITATSKIGSFEVFTTYFLAKLYQYVELASSELHEFLPGQLEQALIDETIDIGITYVPIPKTQIDFAEVTKIKMGVFGTSKYKNSRPEDRPFVVPLYPMGGAPSKVVGLDGWPDHKYSRNVRFKVALMESAIQLCRQSACVAFLPKFIVDLHNQNAISEVKLFELDSPLSQKETQQSVFIMKRKSSKETHLYRQVAKCLRSLS